ncbi:MAG: hypothetical protein ACLFVX_05695 [Archaeoglobaceae archaeon]
MLPEIEEMVSEWKDYLKEHKGYLEEDFVQNLNKKFTVNEEEYNMTAELALKPEGVNFMILKFERLARPLVPLERRTIAIARVIDKNPFPFAILTNNSDSVFMDVIKGKTSYEFDTPSRAESMSILKELNVERLSGDEEGKEKRIFATIDSIKCEIRKD